jgi:hypothetical protein
MATTLTIHVSEELLKRAEQLATARGMTVAKMVERLLDIIATPPARLDELPPLTRSALGMLPPMSDEEVDRTIDEERMRKYGTP